MPNNIEAAKKYITVLDKIYKKGSLTSILDGNPELAKEGASAGELLVAKMTMDDLADYDKTTGYKIGNVNLTWETIKADYDRGRGFAVDSVDNMDSANLAFGQLAGEFIRTKVAPELDTYRFAKYAQTSNILSEPEDITKGDQLVKALRKAATDMDEAEVPAENRVLFITPTLKGMLDDMDTNKSRAVLNKFSAVVEVPQSRFYSKVTLKSDGGYEKDTSEGKNLNFLVVAKDATIQYPKHIAPKIIDRAVNQSADAYMFMYRIVGVCQVYENKTKGIYASIANS